MSVVEAKLSDEKRAILADYWTQTLGYPKDYVSAMTKDYESKMNPGKTDEEIVDDLLKKILK